VRLLLDTQVLLWLFMRSTKMKKAVRAILADPSNTVYASAVSTWEIAIKAGLGKLELPGVPALYLPDRIKRAGLTILSLIPAHTYGVFSLPNHHRDPFDRLLIAQAQAESLTVVTNDRIFAKYDVKRIAV
jgi:PIN domain nuclease of toxin-antitoxin system